MILGQLDLAVALLEGHPGETHAVGGAPVGLPAKPEDGEQTVHETRKALKRLRALLALLRPELGRKRYARENAALRDCARRLAGARDAEVMVGTLDAARAASTRARLARSAAVRRAARAAAGRARRGRRARRPRPSRARGGRSASCAPSRARVERWELRERGFRALAPGLERTYRQGRRRPARRAAQARAGKRCTRGANASRSSATPPRRSTAAAAGAGPRRTPAASRAAPTGSGKCSARSTTSRCSNAGCASAPRLFAGRARDAQAAAQADRPPAPALRSARCARASASTGARRGASCAACAPRSSWTRPGVANGPARDPASGRANLGNSFNSGISAPEPSGAADARAMSRQASRTRPTPDNLRSSPCSWGGWECWRCTPPRRPRRPPPGRALRPRHLRRADGRRRAHGARARRCSCGRSARRG